MATEDCPGANPANADVLKAGCWAEHEDGSLIFVKGTEHKQVVYEIFDLAQDSPVSYNDAMAEDEFKKSFSYKTGTSQEKWTWHDKTPFPWERVMKNFGKPTPNLADAHEILSAAARVAKSLRLRAHKFTQADLGARTNSLREKAGKIMDKILEAIR